MHGLQKSCIKEKHLTCDVCKKKNHQRCIPKSHKEHVPEEGDDYLFICRICYKEESDDETDEELEYEDYELIEQNILTKMAKQSKEIQFQEGSDENIQNHVEAEVGEDATDLKEKKAIMAEKNKETQYQKKSDENLDNKVEIENFAITLAGKNKIMMAKLSDRDGQSQFQKKSDENVDKKVEVELDDIDFEEKKNFLMAKENKEMQYQKKSDENVEKQVEIENVLINDEEKKKDVVLKVSDEDEEMEIDELFSMYKTEIVKY